MFRTKPKYFYKINLISYLLLPFSWIYLLFFFISNIRFRKPKRLANKTICVGNIVCGGSGKTPICLELGRLLNERKENFCYITKGYGRQTEENIVIPKNHNLLFNYKNTGDEALLLSNEADVFVVNNRQKAKCIGYDKVIFDDGFFDKSVKKDVNIAVFDGEFFIGNGCVLPAGPLRNIITSITKADFVIITNPNDNKINEQISFLSVFISRYRILTAKLEVKSKLDKKAKYIAFSGIGENDKFFKTAKESGLNIVDFVGFEDHTEYTMDKIKMLKKKFKNSGANKFLTTTKDAVKLSSDFLQQTDIFEIGYTIENVDEIFDFLEHKK